MIGMLKHPVGGVAAPFDYWRPEQPAVFFPEVRPHEALLRSGRDRRYGCRRVPSVRNNAVWAVRT
jgi:hypothetical protein